jgi:hypothetical protein
LPDRLSFIEYRWVRKNWAGTLACIAGWAAACGGSTGSNGGQQQIALGDLPAEAAKTYCNVIEQCLAGLLAFFPRPECEATFATNYRNDEYAALQAAINAGKVHYDGQKARSCLDALTAMGCDLFVQRNPTICDEAIAGDVPLGGACSIDGECAGLAYCDVRAGVCPGVCAERRGEGQDCDEDNNCQSGLNCHLGLCKAPAMAGQACDGPSGTGCRPGLFCVGASATAAGTCGDPSTVLSAKVGQACDLTMQRLCETGLSCEVDSVTAGVAAFSCHAKSASGQPCALGLPEPCPDGEYCNAAIASPTSGTCTALPNAGQPCASGPTHPLHCAGSLTCVGTTCQAQKANGAGCSVAEECSGGRCTAGVCAGVEFCTQ